VTANYVPLKYLAHLNPETLADSTDLAFSFGYIDIGSLGRGRLRAAPELMSFGDAPSRARRVLREGDSILSTVRTYLRSAWTVPSGTGQLVASTGFVCLRPRVGVDSRYLGWLVQSDAVIETVVARSVGVSYPAISLDEVGRIEVPCPAEPRQREVADFLDLETSRIDALIATMQQMVKLLEERQSSWLHSVVKSSSKLKMPGMVPLKAVAQWVEGPGISAVDFRDEGVPLLRIRNLVEDTVDLTGCGFVPESLANERWNHLRVRAGELLVSGSARSGTPVVVPPEAAGAVPYTGLLRIWPVSSRLERAYLRLFLSSPAFEVQIDRLKTGVGLQHWGPSHLSQIQIPLPSVDEQIGLAADFASEEQRHGAMSRLLKSQIGLFEERRKALVTLAVTGQLDIPEAA